MIRFQPKRIRNIEGFVKGKGLEKRCYIYKICILFKKNMLNNTFLGDVSVLKLFPGFHRCGFALIAKTTTEFFIVFLLGGVPFIGGRDISYRSNQFDF